MHRFPPGVLVALAVAGSAAAQQRVAFPNNEAPVPGHDSTVRGEDLIYHHG